LEERLLKKHTEGKKIGHDLVKKCLENIKEKSVKISAQSYLKKFYSSHGFKAEGEEYLEDGIPHTAMFISRQ